MRAVTNLFLIGAAKSGTTTLSKYLGEHPRIATLAIKEPGHFCTDISPTNFSRAYERLIQWDEQNYFDSINLEPLHLGFVQERSNYHRLVANAATMKPEASYLLDASTAYLLSKTAPKELYKYNPKAKLIVVLRNPADRAFSHYTMALKYGMEKLPPMLAFERESQLQHPQWGVNECFLELGRYHDQLSNWLKVFPREQLLVLFHDELRRTPKIALARVAEFLDLPTFAVGAPKKENMTTVPKYPWINAMGMRALAPVRQKLPKEVVATLKNALQTKPPKMEEEVENYLKRYYTQEVTRLEELLEINLTHWK
jgi:hypothetical protein